MVSFEALPALPELRAPKMLGAEASAAMLKVQLPFPDAFSGKATIFHGIGLNSWLGIVNICQHSAAKLQNWLRNKGTDASL